MDVNQIVPHIFMELSEAMKGASIPFLLYRPAEQIVPPFE